MGTLRILRKTKDFIEEDLLIERESEEVSNVFKELLNTQATTGNLVDISTGGMGIQIPKELAGAEENSLIYTNLSLVAFDKENDALNEIGIKVFGIVRSTRDTDDSKIMHIMFLGMLESPLEQCFVATEKP